MLNHNFWSNKKVFLTGNTGFKGSWISLWLLKMGATVKGYSLGHSTTPSLFDEWNLHQSVDTDFGDIGDLEKLKISIERFNPDIIIHMAAQPLVRASYLNTAKTFETNVMGTVNLFEAAKNLGNIAVIINVTTDKVYKNNEWSWGYRENDVLGGSDPYSASKSCSELVTESFRSSVFDKLSGPAISTVRAGNVIGGGDWSADRLVPDIFRAIFDNEQLVLRNPHSTRPWQLVLEPLSGYLQLAEKMYQNKVNFSSSWNFGPKIENSRPVLEVVKMIYEELGVTENLLIERDAEKKEAELLKLDISKVQNQLGWSPKYDLLSTIQRTVFWQKNYWSSENTLDLSLKQITEYESA